MAQGGSPWRRCRFFAWQSARFTGEERPRHDPGGAARRPQHSARSRACQAEDEDRLGALERQPAALRRRGQGAHLRKRARGARRPARAPARRCALLPGIRTRWRRGDLVLPRLRRPRRRSAGMVCRPQDPHLSRPHRRQLLPASCARRGYCRAWPRHRRAIAARRHLQDGLQAQRDDRALPSAGDQHALQPVALLGREERRESAPRRLRLSRARRAAAARRSEPCFPVALPAPRLARLPRRSRAQRAKPRGVARLAHPRAKGLRPLRLDRSAAIPALLHGAVKAPAAPPHAPHPSLLPMAVYGVLGDIHGNVEALRAVLAALDARGVRELLCVGDVVGYNADPDECAALLRTRWARVIAGNHDLIGTRQLGFSRCANNARYALERTRRTLSCETAAWLAALPRRLLIEETIALVHGGVRDVQLYMTTPH